MLTQLSITFLPNMLQTTLIGSYPKPDYLEVPDWWKDKVHSFVKLYVEYLNKNDGMRDYTELKATKDVIESLDRIGVDVLTDGEIRRADYISYHCCHLQGIDSKNLQEKQCRGGAYSYLSPVINAPVSAREPFLASEILTAELFTKKPVKVQLPGPVTIRDTIIDSHYGDDLESYMKDMSAALNTEIISLAKSGVKYIQIDEPVFARQPELALSVGIKYLNDVFKGLEAYPDVTKMVHICCGYPDSLNNETNYKRASPEAYNRLLPALDEVDNLDYICIEDAHRYNDKSVFKCCKKKGIVLGVIKIASTEVETVSHRD